MSFSTMDSSSPSGPTPPSLQSAPGEETSSGESPLFFLVRGIMKGGRKGRESDFLFKMGGILSVGRHFYSKYTEMICSIRTYTK